MNIEVQQWKHYTLKASGSRAVAFLTHAKTTGVAPISQATENDAAGAIATIKEQLNELEASRTLDTERNILIPSEPEFRYAIAAHSVPNSVAVMMHALAMTGRQGITAGKLARQAGYSDYPAANLQLGKAAHALASMLGLSSPKDKYDKDHVAATFLLASEGPPDERTGNWTWCPRPSFTAAYTGC